MAPNLNLLQFQMLTACEEATLFLTCRRPQSSSISKDFLIIYLGQRHRFVEAILEMERFKLMDESRGHRVMNQPVLGGMTRESVGKALFETLPASQQMALALQIEELRLESSAIESVTGTSASSAEIENQKIKSKLAQRTKGKEICIKNCYKFVLSGMGTRHLLKFIYFDTAHSATITYPLITSSCSLAKEQIG